MKNNRLEERRKRIPTDIDNYVERSFQIVDRIYQILSEQGKDQKTLAKALGKNESEISKWMTGTHNFTLKSLSKIETVLGQAIFEIAGKATRQEEFTTIDQVFFTIKNQGADKKTIYPVPGEYSPAYTFNEPSELLS
jgi:transcriptional regulator with XRE-family HTH domain